MPGNHATASDSGGAGLLPRLAGSLWLIASAACLALALLVVRTGDLDIVVEIAVTTSDSGQLFYSRGGAYDETRSLPFRLVPDGRFRTYEFRIEERRLPRLIRIDPGAATGDIRIRRIGFAHEGRHETLSGDALKAAIEPLHDVRKAPGGDDVTIFAQGPDPHFQLAIPDGVRWPSPWRLALAIALAIAAAACLWMARRWLAWTVSLLDRVPDQLRWPALGALSTLLILRASGITLSGTERLQAALSGSGLMVALLGFAAVGAAVFGVLGRRAPGIRFGLPAMMLAGQAVVMLYVYVRSLPSALGFHLPVTQYEILALVAACIVLVARFGTPGQRLPAGGTGWLLFQLAAVYGLCLVVAERELPRLVMLSTDPDNHAFFARQVMELGSVPWTQDRWGGEAFNYPAGTGVLIAAWSWLSWLDPRNTASVLSFLVYFLGALTIAEAVATRESIRGRALLALLAVALVSAAYLLPLHAGYVHMEGFGRVVCFGFLAVLAVSVFWSCRDFAMPPRAVALMALSLFSLACLNPVNAVAGGLVLGVGAFWLLCSGRIAMALGMLSVLGVVLLAPVDPYYWEMFRGGGFVQKVSLGEGLIEIDILGGMKGGLLDFASRPLHYVKHVFALLPGAKPWGAFALLSALFVGWAACQPARSAFRAACCAAAFLLVGALALSVTAQFSIDRRFYLLNSYLKLAIAQAEIVFALGMSLGIVHRLLDLPRKWIAIAASAAIVAASAAVVREGQVYRSGPKRDYCGGIQCPVATEVQVLDQFRTWLLAVGADPDRTTDRVLVPNNVVRLGHEHWLFPAGIGRVAPHEDIGPVAFFYYQGDAAYTTENYIARVCERFDVEWLRSHQIRYVLLPQSAGGWCIHNHDLLAARWATVAQVGNAKVIDLSRGRHDP